VAKGLAVSAKVGDVSSDVFPAFACANAAEQKSSTEPQSKPIYRIAYSPKPT
jgi:hypothetical protein